MQSLEVISVNLWAMLISLANLAILYWILKKFLFKPVKKVLAQRQAELDSQYAAAGEAQQRAMQDQQAWAEKLRGAQDEADALLKTAADDARSRGERIVAEARSKADGMIRQAEAQTALERKKAEQGIKREIADTSVELAQKLIGREMNEQDHRALINAFIDEMGGADGGAE